MPKSCPRGLDAPHTTGGSVDGGRGGGAAAAAAAVSPCLLLFIRLLSRLRQQAGVRPSSSLSPSGPYEYNQGQNSPLLSV